MTNTIKDILIRVRALLYPDSISLIVKKVEENKIIGNEIYFNEFFIRLFIVFI